MKGMFGQFENRILATCWQDGLTHTRCCKCFSHKEVDPTRQLFQCERSGHARSFQHNLCLMHSCVQLCIVVNVEDVWIRFHRHREGAVHTSDGSNTEMSINHANVHHSRQSQVEERVPLNVRCSNWDLDDDGQTGKKESEESCLHSWNLDAEHTKF